MIYAAGTGNVRFTGTSDLFGPIDITINALQNVLINASELTGTVTDGAGSGGGGIIAGLRPLIMGGFEDGEDGLPGIQGVKGDTGATGPAGATGSAGQSGLFGQDGEDGLDGIIGIKGEKGLSGQSVLFAIDGEDGQDGLIGIQGLTGAQGATGAQGIAGASGTSGLIAVDGEDGQDGLLNIANIIGGVPSGSFKQSITTSGSQSTVTFTGIPPVGTNLLVTFVGRATGAVGTINVFMRINADNTGNYKGQSLTGSGGTASSGLATGTSNGAFIFNVAGTSATTVPLTGADITIYQYSQSSAFKMFTSKFHCVNGTAGIGQVGIVGNQYGTGGANTAITELEFIIASGSFLDGAIFTIQTI